MKKIYLVAIVLFSVTLLILFVLYNRYTGHYEEEQTNAYISKNIDILNENLDFERRYALSLSLYISKNSQIIEALRTQNQRLALREMADFLGEIKRAAGIDNIDIQLHTKEIRAFARSWEKSAYLGTELKGFRKGLVRVKESGEPFVSIELGKRLNIKAISPIFDAKKQYIGSIEVIMGFENIKQRLKKFDLDILGLLDEKFLNIAVDIRDHASVGHYRVVEKNYPKHLYGILRAHPEILQEKKAYFAVGNHLVALIPMLSVGIEDVGIIALSMKKGQQTVPSENMTPIKQENRLYQFHQKYREVIIK